jgi:hypothetical protein
MSRLLYHLSYTAKECAPPGGPRLGGEITGCAEGVVAAAGFEPATFGL